MCFVGRKMPHQRTKEQMVLRRLRRRRRRRMWKQHRVLRTRKHEVASMVYFWQQNDPGYVLTHESLRNWQHDYSDIAGKSFHSQVSRSHLCTLVEGSSVSVTIIDAYCHLLTERCNTVILPSSIYDGIINGLDNLGVLFEEQRRRGLYMFFMPIHYAINVHKTRYHWSLLVGVVSTRILRVYNSEEWLNGWIALDKVSLVLKNVFKHKKEWTVEVVEHIPQQIVSSDSGVCVLLFLRVLLLHHDMQSLIFSPAFISQVRLIIVHELLAQCIDLTWVVPEV